MISKNLWEIVNFNYFKILDFHIAEKCEQDKKKEKYLRQQKDKHLL